MTTISYYANQPREAEYHYAMEWLRLAMTRSVVRRASAVALVVGTILIAINHGEALLRGDLSLGRVLKMVMTMMVPYCVSTYSSVCAMRERMASAPHV